MAAILPEEGIGEPELRHVPVELISPNSQQPRRRFDPESIAALARSIADAGVVQPLIVRPLADWWRAATVHAIKFSQPAAVPAGC